MVEVILAKPGMRMCCSLHFKEEEMGTGIRRQCICARELIRKLMGLFSDIRCHILLLLLTVRQYGVVRFSIHAASVNFEFSWMLPWSGYGHLKTWPQNVKILSLEEKRIINIWTNIYKHLTLSVKLPKTFHEKRLYHYWMNLECTKHSWTISCFYSLFFNFSYSHHYILSWLFSAWLWVA